jgi:hypothetical protein
MLRTHWSRKRLTVGASAAVAGFALAGAGTAIATGALTGGDQVVIQPASPASNSGSSVAPSAAPNWPKNASGQTYGSSLDSTSSATDPVLAQVIATNGEQGYVYSSQLNPAPPASPSAAVAQQQANTGGQYIPVYAQDGTTVIGQFEVSEPGHTDG